MKTKKKKQTEEPEIYAIRKGKKGVELERRDLLKFLGAFTGATLVGCDDISKKVISNVLGEPTQIPQTINAEACSSLFAHSDGILSISFGPDGKILASASLDGKIKLWSIPDGKLMKTLEGHSGRVSFVCFSQDGKILASGGEDKTIKLWSITGRSLLKTLEGHSGSIQAVCFNHDGKTIASGSEDTTIKLWSVTEGGLLRTLEGHTGSVDAVCFCPDGKTLASGSKDTIVKLWSVPEGDCLKTLEVSYDSANTFLSEVKSVCFSPDGKILASGSGSSIKLWSVSDGKLLKTLSEHTDIVNAVSFSPDGQILASGSTDNKVKLWSMPDGQILKTLEGHSGSVSSVCFNPNDNMLASGSNDKTIKLWQWTSNADIETTDSYQEGLTNLIPPYIESGNYIAVNSRPNDTDRIQILDLKENAVILSVKTNSIIRSLALQSGSKFVLIGDYKGTVKWWNLENTEEKSKFSAHEGRISGIIIKKNNKEFITASHDGKIKIWSFPENKCLKTLEINIGSINGIVLSPDEKVLVLYTDNILQLWSLESFSLIKSNNEIQNSKFEGNKSDSKSENLNLNNITFTNTVQFTSISSKLLIGTVKGFIIYDYLRDVIVNQFESEKSIISLSVSQNEKFVAIAYEYGNVEIIDFNNLVVLKTFGISESIQRLAFVNENMMVAYNNNGIRLYKFKSLIDDIMLTTCLYDKKELAEETEGIRYSVGSETYTLPCGSPIPPGSVCTCNCITMGPPKTYYYGGGGYYVTYWYPN